MTDQATVTSAITVLADDLSGAAETASKFLGRRTALTLHLDAGATLSGEGVSVLDLNTRTMTEDDAQRTLRTALATIPAGALLITKVDSMLRGHIGAQAAALGDRGPVVVAAALPVLRRTVEGGVLHLDGVPQHRTAVWSAEPASPPATVAELFGDLPTASIPTGAELAESLAKAAANGQIAICDAATDSDLDAIVRASRSIHGVQLVGTAALAAAVARTLPSGTRGDSGRRPSTSVLTVVGTAEPTAAEQVAHLVAHGCHHLAIDVDALLNGTADPTDVSDALDLGPVVITMRGATTPDRARALSAALGSFVTAGQAKHRPDLILTGGETARAVVDAIGLTTLQPVHEVHHGAVASTASDGRSVVTRPGSFGDATSLTAIADYLTGTPREHRQSKDVS
jgi:4-hydroxythreonine-4-phosphate dehydrogenase